MQLSSGKLVHSPTDLVDYLECAHLLWRTAEVARGLMADDCAKDELGLLLIKKGEQHEAEWLERFRAEGEVAEIPHHTERSERIERTREAMRRGVPVVYQAAFAPPGWIAYPDFLRRVDRPSKLGAWSYEVLDTKLAREARPDFAIQLALYSDLVALEQGRCPDRMHLALGSGELRSMRCADYDAYSRRLALEYLDFTAALDGEVYPHPVEHCGVCGWRARCAERWERDDHLGRVAGIRRDQIRKLVDGGVPTLAALARHDGARIPKLSDRQLKKLHGQARLHVREQDSGRPEYDLLAREPGRGFELLPPPDPGDVFFDMEGDPHVDGGLEYLFGVVYEEDGEWRYRPWWAHGRVEERLAVEALVDWLADRRTRYPGMHVYHYAAYEPGALKRLCGRHGTREDALDVLLRARVLVDLYQVVRQSMQVSRPGYSIKQMEAFYAGARAGEVRDASASIVYYERWRADPARDALLEEIRAYNEEDCRSTRALRDWLLERAGEAGWDPSAPRPEPALARDSEPTDQQRQAAIETAALRERLLAGMPRDLTECTPAQRGRRLLAHALDYHQREKRSTWWAYFDRLAKDSEDLRDDAETIVHLTPAANAPPRPEKHSLVHTFTFDPQESKIRPGVEVVDQANGAKAGTIVEIDAGAGRLELKRGPSLSSVPLPDTIFVHNFISDDELRASLRRLAQFDENDRIGAAVRGLLAGALPQRRGLLPGMPLHSGSVDEDAAYGLIESLDDSHLFVQGPPGSGKTWLGARVIVRLLAAGARVGINANSHPAIHNLLQEIEAVAAERNVDFRGVKKSTELPDYDPERKSRFITETKSNEVAEQPRWNLVAGTYWLFARPAMIGTLDYLFFDEAGQIAVANAAACGAAARNLVFLGDPQQLSHVTQGSHPEGSGRSVLEHLLGRDPDAESGGHDTVSPMEGLFLDRTYRLHPEICAFISRIAYEDRLHADARTVRRRLAGLDGSGTGLRFLPVEHEGNGQRSEEEARRVREIYDELLRGRFVEDGEGERPLTGNDILVVAPYNAHVNCLRRALPAGARVGTVDKFQGQEAPAVIYSLASSSQENVPRGLEFLFSRNRLNVAISRAQCLSILVASPRLLTSRCRTVDQIKLVNALCRFVDLAGDAADPWGVSALPSLEPSSV